MIVVAPCDTKNSSYSARKKCKLWTIQDETWGNWQVPNIYFFARIIGQKHVFCSVSVLQSLLGKRSMRLCDWPGTIPEAPALEHFPCCLENIPQMRGQAPHLPRLMLYFTLLRWANKHSLFRAAGQTSRTETSAQTASGFDLSRCFMR